MPETKSNCNGWKKNPRFLITLGMILASVTGAFFVLKTTVALQSDISERADENLQKQVDTKVDKVEYIECVKRIENGTKELKEDVQDIKTTQQRMEEKVDRILLK